MKDCHPKVSIVIPVYNGADYLCEAIDSALGQTYSNVEIIVVNDGSDDSGCTEIIAKSYGEKIRYFEKDNGGVSTALNLGIRVMEGEYFSWLSHDDVYFPEKIESQIHFLENIGREVILYSDYQYIDSNSNYLRTKKVFNIPPEKFKKIIISRSGLVHGCTLLIPRSFLLEVGSFNERLHTVQDYDLWLRMADQFDFMHIPTVLISSRIHSQQGVRARRTLFQEECNEFYSSHLQRIFDEWRDSESIESLAEFSVKSAIKMERFGLGYPTRMCREVLRRTWFIELLKANPKFCYWLGYYLLFRFKRLLTN